jgi:hypothetical protein
LFRFKILRRLRNLLVYLYVSDGGRDRNLEERRPPLTSVMRYLADGKVRWGFWPPESQPEENGNGIWLGEDDPIDGEGGGQDTPWDKGSDEEDSGDEVAVNEEEGSDNRDEDDEDEGEGGSEAERLPQKSRGAGAAGFFAALAIDSEDDSEDEEEEEDEEDLGERG